MSEASWVPRLITTINPAQDAAGATIVTSGDLQVDPNSHSTPITSAFTVSTALTALEPSKRVWTLIGIGGHLAMSPLPHHRAYGSVPRRFGRLSGHGLSR